jgi:hypothetical protein
MRSGKQQLVRSPNWNHHQSKPLYPSDHAKSEGFPTLPGTGNRKSGVSQQVSDHPALGFGLTFRNLQMNRRKLKPLITVGLVLIANGIVAVCAGMALLIAIFRGDLLMAAVPGVVAAIGILLQPWFLLFFSLPGLSWFSPVFTTAITIPIYRSLDRLGTFDRLKPWLNRWKPWQIVRTVAIALLAGAGLVYARYRDFPAISHGLPEPIAAELKSSQIRLQNSNLYTVADFFDSEYLWQARLTPQEFEKFQAALGKEMKVESLARDRITPAFLQHPPYWWNPELTAKAEVYGSPNFPIEGSGHDSAGLSALLLWIPERQAVYLWLKNKSSF